MGILMALELSVCTYQDGATLGGGGIVIDKPRWESDVVKPSKSRQIMLACLWTHLLATPAWSQEPRLEVQLTSERNQVVLGEPVILTLRLRNATAEKSRIDFGGNYEENVRFVVDGVTFPPPPGTGFGRFQSIGIMTLEPGETGMERFVLDHWKRLDVEGLVEVRFSLVSEPAVEAVTTIEVLPRDPETLAKSCASLARQANSYVAETAMLGSLALSYVDDEVCLGSLVVVLRESFHGKKGAIVGLVRVGTEPALRAIAEAWGDLEPGLRASASVESTVHGKRDALWAELLKAGVEGADLPRSTGWRKEGGEETWTSRRRAVSGSVEGVAGDSGVSGARLKRGLARYRLAVA